jgi:hypothetical protein
MLVCSAFSSGGGANLHSEQRLSKIAQFSAFCWSHSTRAWQRANVDVHTLFHSQIFEIEFYGFGF